MKVTEYLIGIPVLVFILWLFAAPLPIDRINRGCEPITWLGNLATSTTALSVADSTATTARWSDKLNYSCRYMVWRLVYQDAYNLAIKDGRMQAIPESGASAPTSASASTAE